MARKSKSLPGSDMAVDLDEAEPTPVRGGDDPAFVKPSGYAVKAVTFNGSGSPQAAAEIYPARLIPITQIYTPANYRHEKKPDKKAHEAKIEELMKSIAAAGLEQPIRVYELPDGQRASDGKLYELSFGFRRLEACRRLGWEAIPAQVLPPAPQALIKQARAIENLHRDDPTPAGELLMVRDILAAAGGDHKQAAAALGKSESWVRDRDYLSRCTPLVIEMLDTGRLLLGHARLLAKVGDPKEQDSFARMAGRGAHDGQTGAMWPVERLAQTIAEAQRSLKIVPWKLEVAFAGKPPCSTCPHNTASDPMLFEIGREDAGLGNCTNSACFDAKQHAAQKAKEKTVETLKKKEQEPSAENVRHVAPEYLKDQNVIGFARRQLGEPKKAAAAGGASSGSSSAPKRSEVEVWNGAAGKYDGAVEKWMSVLENRCFDALEKADPLVRIATLAVLASQDWGKMRQRAVGNMYSYPPKKAEIMPFKPVGPALATTIDRLSNPTLETITRLGTLKWTDYFDVNSAMATCPDALARMAAALGVNVSEPLPTWDQFKPKEKAKDADPAGEPATKKRAKGGKGK